jgi:hypothetical protein
MPWISPFELPGHWYKGNLHTHTTQSDGKRNPDQVCAWYQSHGYDFIAITDHWVHTNGSLYTNRDWLTLTGSELDGPGYHMLTLGLRELPDAALGEDPAMLAAEVVRLGGLPFFAHPYWTGQASASLCSAPSIVGIEVYNSVCDHGIGKGYSRVHWDESLAAGARLFGLAVDDSHGYLDEEGYGFVMVRAQSLNEEAILAALRGGAFFASTGPAITDLCLTTIEHQQLGLVVRCSPCRYITFYGAGPTGKRFTANPGEYISQAVIPIAIDQVFLRVECEDEAGRIAWSNPLYVADVLTTAQGLALNA